MEEIESPNSSIKKIGKIISNDIGMTAKMLQIANSAFFGLQRTVTEPTEAVKFLGLETVSSLALAIGVFSQIEKGVNPGYISEIWNHSILVAKIAKDIAQVENPELAEACYTAGLLHEIGELVLISNAPIMA